MKSLDVLHLMRQNPKRSMRATSRDLDIPQKTVIKTVGSAFTKRRGRYYPKPADRLRRSLIFYDARGQITIETHSFKQASEVARYHNAVRAYLFYGDASGLAEFRGRSLKIKGNEYPYITDTRTLNRLSRAGVLSFLTIYANSGDNQ